MLENLPQATYASLGGEFPAEQSAIDMALRQSTDALVSRTFTAVIGSDLAVAGEKHDAPATPFEQFFQLGRFPIPSEEQLDLAVSAACTAQPAWAALSAEARAAVVRTLAGSLAAERTNLAIATLYETGKPLLEAVVEVDKAIALAGYYADQCVAAGGAQDLGAIEAGARAQSVMRPYGVFAALSSSNEPLAQTLDLVLGALLGGNAVVLVPAHGCGITARLLVDALLAAGVPEGTINLLYGLEAARSYLAGHPGIDAIAFAGTAAEASALRSTSVTKPFIAQLGGSNAAYVTASADIAAAARAVAASAFVNQGQAPGGCKVVYVEAGVRDAFVEALLAETASLKVGDPRQKVSKLGTLHSKAALDAYLKTVAEASEAGTLLCGGDRLKEITLARGNYVNPAIVEFADAHPLTRAELPMPLLCLRAVASLEEGLAEGNASDFGLAAALYSADAEEQALFLDRIEAGTVTINAPRAATTGVWPGAQSLSGWKASGTTGRGALGPNWLALFMREQSRTLFS